MSDEVAGSRFQSGNILPQRLVFIEDAIHLSFPLSHKATYAVAPAYGTMNRLLPD